jgi:predicted nucleic acid-binding protein
MGRDFDIVDFGSEIAEEGADICHWLGIPMADSMAMATAKRYNLSCVTDDPHFSEVKRIWVRCGPGGIHPVKPANQIQRKGSG